MTAAGFTQEFDPAASLQAAGGADGEHALDVACAAFALRAEARLAPQDTTMAVITQNLAFSATCVAMFLALSAAGYVHPVLAVILHTASALVVIVNSARLIRAGEDLQDYDTSAQPEETPVLRPIPLRSLEGKSC